MDYVDFLKSIVELFCAVSDQGGELAHVFKVRAVEIYRKIASPLFNPPLQIYILLYYSAWIAAGITSFLSYVAA